MAKPIVTLVPADDAITLRVYDHDELIAVPLEPKQALLLAIDLLELIAGRELSIERLAEPLWGPDRWGDTPDLG
jgi:hypothetical protein